MSYYSVHTRKKCVFEFFQLFVPVFKVVWLTNSKWDQLKYMQSMFIYHVSKLHSENPWEITKSEVWFWVCFRLLRLQIKCQLNAKALGCVKIRT